MLDCLELLWERELSILDIVSRLTIAKEIEEDCDNHEEKKNRRKVLYSYFTVYFLESKCLLL